MQEILLTLAQFHAIRRAKNLELYAVEGKPGMMELFCQPSNGILLRAQINAGSQEWSAISSHVNKPVIFYDKRIVSHDFAHSSSWPTEGDPPTPNSMFRITPDVGSKFVLTHNIVRFPKTLGLIQTNRLFYKIFLSLDGVTPANQEVAVINLEYASVADLIRKSNVPMVIASDSVTNAFVTKVVELEFRYADPYTFRGAPIILHSSLQEKIEISMENDSPMLDIDGNPLAEECYIVMNFRKTPEF